MTQEQKTALITGANIGIGKEVARQLAVSDRYSKIYLACRNRKKAAAAKADLEDITGKAIFEILHLDVSDLVSVDAALAVLQEPIDDLVMNAGGSGGNTPLAVGQAGVTDIFASNVLGHVALLDGLIATGRLRRTAVYAGSEAARGVPKLGMRPPELETGSVDEIAAFCDGSYFAGRKPNGTLAYGQVKLVAALWMGSVARQHTGLRFITMSPGNTAGTNVGRDLPAPIRLLMRYVLVPVVMPLFGLVQAVEKGAARLVRALDDTSLSSGAFYASEAKALTGAIVDQSTILPALAQPSYQDSASAAVHRFIAA